VFDTRPSMRGRGSGYPGDGTRRTGRWGWRPVAAAGLCAVAAGTLLYPGLVFGGAQAAAEDLGAVTQIETRAAQAAAPLSEGDALVRLPWGTGHGRVGLERPKEGLARGPEAVAVSPDGRIALLDGVNDRLVTLDASGAFLLSIPIELTQPRFLAVTDERLYVLDCDTDGLLLSVDWTGGGAKLSELPPLEDVVTGLLVADEGVCVELAHDRVFLTTESVGLVAAGRGSGLGKSRGKASFKQMAGRPVGHRSGRMAKVTLDAGKRVRVESFRTERGGLKAAPTAQTTPALFKGRPIDHLVSVDGDVHGSLIFGARLADGDDARGGAVLALTRLTGDGGAGAEPARGSQSGAPGIRRSVGPIEDTLLLSDCPFAYLGQPYVVAPDGRVIQPFADKNGYSLLVHRFPETVEVTP
jgi:hypothetical protein